MLLFLYTRTRTYHTISLAGFFSDLNFLHPSVYIAVLGGDHVSDHVWQVRNKAYLFARVRVRCLRDLRGDIEARQDVLQGQLTDQDHRLTAKSYRTVPFSTALLSAIITSKAPRSELSKIRYFVFCVSQVRLGLNPSLSEPLYVSFSFIFNQLFRHSLALSPRRNYQHQSPADSSF